MIIISSEVALIDSSFPIYTEFHKIQILDILLFLIYDHDLPSSD